MLPALRITQTHVVPQNRVDWPGIAAEILATTDSRPYDFRFEGKALYLCFGLTGRRKDSVVFTIEPFLANGGGSAEEVKRMHAAWTKSLVLQAILWSYPYIKSGDF